MAFSLTRVKSLLGGDAFNWLNETFVKGNYDSSGKFKEIVNKDGSVFKFTRPSFQNAKRPVIIHIGNSFAAQDWGGADASYSATAGNVTAGQSTYLGWTSVANMPWLNAVLGCPFDYLFGVEPAATIYPTASTVPMINGVYGWGGATLIGQIEHAIPRVAQLALQRANGAKIFALITPYENDINNNDVVGYHQVMNRKIYQTMNMLIDMGITPILNTMAPSTFINTATKSYNFYACRDYALNLAITNPDLISVNCSDLYRDTSQVNGYPWPISYASDAEAVALNAGANGAANAKKFSLFNRHSDATGGGGLHPNARAQMMRTLAQADAIKNAVISGMPLTVGGLSPVNLSENSTFEATTGTAVAGGTNVAAGASTTFKGWQRNAFGANTQINVTDIVDADGRVIPKVEIDVTSAAAASDFSGLSSTLQASSLASPGVSIAQYYEDVEITQANNVLNLERQVRLTGGIFIGLSASTGSANDISDSPSDNQKGYRNHVGMLEGKRIVLSSYPFYIDPTPQNLVRNIGGGKMQKNAPFTGVGDKLNSRTSQVVRFAGLKLK